LSCVLATTSSPTPHLMPHSSALRRELRERRLRHCASRYAIGLFRLSAAHCTMIREPLLSPLTFEMTGEAEMPVGRLA